MGIINFLLKFGDDLLRFGGGIPGLFNSFKIIVNGYWYILLIIIVGFLIYYVRKKRHQS
jgi:hypothetical protein